MDVGSSAVRVCELVRTKTGYQLAKYYQQEFNADPAQDDMALRAARAKALEEVLKRAKIRTKKTVFAVPGQSVFTRTRTLPPVPEYKVNQIVKYEIQQQIPFSLDQIAMDYQILSRTDSGGYEVMMAAIKVEVIDKQIDVIHSVKREIDMVDVGPLAAYNWLKHAGEFGTGGECVAMIDIGASTTDIVIERENQFRFTRPLNVGGNDITLAIAAAFGMNFSDAERLKRERGFAPTGDPQRDGKGGEVIGKVLQRFSTEVIRSFAYFRSLPGGGQVNRVLLCGGGACLRNIIPYLQQALGVEVRIAQPLSGLAVAPAAQQANEHPEQACVVLGLALRTLANVPLEINLVPPRVVEAARRKEQALYWSLSLATLALIMASIIPDSANKNEVVKDRIATMRQFINQYDPVIAQRMSAPDVPAPPSGDQQRLQEARQAISGYQAQVDVLARARRGQRFWLDELALLFETRANVRNLWFCSVETTPVVGDGQGGQQQQQPQRGQRGGGGLSELAGIQGGGRPGGAGVGIPAGKYPGFPGIASGISTGAGPRGGGLAQLGGGRQGGRAGGGGDQQQGGGPREMPIPRALAFIVHGYAESDETINTFVADLRRASRSLPSNEQLSVGDVIFSEASVARVDPAILFDAPCGERVAGDRGGVYNPALQQSMYSFSLVVEFQRGGPTQLAGGAPNPAGSPL